jgi:4-hydroxy-tetrahydrodipicolinate reductase
MTNVAIHGAAGRMGQRLVALIAADKSLRLAAAVERPGHDKLGADAGVVAGVGELGVAITDRLPAAGVDVVIDFSLPEGALSVVNACCQRGWPLVLATTGFSADERAQIEAAAKQIPLVWAANMSLAVNLLIKLTRIAAQALRDHPGGADVEIIERHHRHKVDSPSGTALEFGRVVAEAMGQAQTRHGREGLVGARPHGEIGYHAVRVGDNPGEHTIIFAMPGESIELSVRATSRDSYAYGALVAARFLVDKGPGLYRIDDVLGL